VLPARIRQVHGRWIVEERNNADASRTPFRHACRTYAISQDWPVPALSGCSRPRRDCPQVDRPAAAGSAGKVSHLRSTQERLSPDLPCEWGEIWARWRERCPLR
jgi:hypothetical protein